MTICSKHGECLFGSIDGHTVRLTREGRIIQDFWKAIPGHFHGVDLDEFVIMPNHLHGIVILGEDRRGEVTSPLRSLATELL